MKESYLNPALEYFAKGLTDINNAIAHVRLYGGEGKEETIKSMLEYASEASNTKELV